MNTKDTNTYVNECRVQSANFLLTVQKLHALNKKFVALDLYNTLNDSDIGGDNEGVTKAQIAAVLGTSLTAIQALLDSGHATNLHTIAAV